MIKFVFLLLFFILNSCNLIRLLNVSEETEENNEQIKLFLSKHKYCYDYSFENIDSTSILLKSSKYRINNDSIRYSFIQLRIYDSIGNLYSGYSQCMGNFNNRKFLDSLPPSKNSYPYLNTKLKFKDELDLLNISPSVKLQVIEEIKKNKYIFVVYWTIWTNYFSKHVLREVSKIKSSNPSKVLVIFVNTAKDKITFNSNKN